MFDFDVQRDFRRPLTSRLVRTVRFTEFAIENSVENSYNPSMRPHPSQREDNQSLQVVSQSAWHPCCVTVRTGLKREQANNLKYCRATVQVQGLKLPHTPWFVTCYVLQVT